MHRLSHDAITLYDGQVNVAILFLKPHGRMVRSQLNLNYPA